MDKKENYIGIAGGLLGLGLVAISAAVSMLTGNIGHGLLVIGVGCLVGGIITTIVLFGGDERKD